MTAPPVARQLEHEVAKTLPNFLVIGAGRSGTTSLHHYLRQHPDVFIPARKSPSYFYTVDAEKPSDRLRRLETRAMFVSDPGQYAALFEGAAGKTAVGEVSPAYLASIRVPDRIAEELPRVRLAAVIRSPVERFWSRFVARRRDGLESVADPAAIIEREQRGGLPRDDAAGTYLAAGFVSHVLTRYRAVVPAERMRVYLYEDLVADPAALMRDLFGFLRVDPDVPINVGQVHNASRGEIAAPVRRAVWTRTALLRTWLRPFVARKIRDRAFGYFASHREVAPIPEDTRAALADAYRSEVQALAHLLDRDLSHWLEPPSTSSEPPPSCP